MLKLKRAYDAPSRSDGRRFLVERLWPRGIRKEDLPLDGWLKDVAPSPVLRQWFAHDPAKWPEFRRRYKVIEANVRGPFPVPMLPSTVLSCAVAGTIALVLLVAAPALWTLISDLVLVMLPLERERVREQWTWAGWLGAATGGAVAAGITVAIGLRGSTAGGLGGVIAAVGLSAVFFVRNASGESSAHRWRLAGLELTVLVLATIIAAIVRIA